MVMIVNGWGFIVLLELVEFVEFIGLLGLLEFFEFVEFLGLTSLFPWIEVGDCGECSVVFSGFLFQKLVECLIGETFRVPGVTILSCAVARLFFFFLLDLVKFTV